MHKMYYPKLAAGNLKKNGKIYLPYLLTCIGTVMMFYLICALTLNSHLKELIGGEVIAVILLYGTIVVGLFALIFLFYSNSFLVKRRKKEFGLYNILGMEKKHISKIMLFESLYVTLISLTAGIGLGILLNKLAFMGLLKLLHFPVPLGFEIPTKAVLSTLLLFACIFLLTLLNNLRQIHLVNPIELLRGGQVGEKEPKANWIAAALGLICLAAGYAIALLVKDPISALLLFFIAVVLVVLGTYLLFQSGSVVLLKLLRKNKKFYYQTNHFISVSGMMYRMKQNAAGLANICILSTMVLVMVSGTVSLYTGMDDILKTRYPKEFMLSSNLEESNTSDRSKELVAPVLARHGTPAKDEVSYRYLSFAGVQDGTTITVSNNYGNIQVTDSIASLYFVPLEDYNRATGDNVSLETSSDALLFYNRTPYKGDTLSVFDQTFQVQVREESFQIDGFDSAQMNSGYFLIVKDTGLLDQLNAKQKEAYGEDSSDIRHYYGFDMDADADTQIAVFQDIQSTLEAAEYGGRVECRQNEEASSYSLYGGLLFLGIFLGLLFVMATVLIIYYKQISEGYDDKSRFAIMQKVGMSHKEVKKSIHSQVLTVFFLPLLTAGVHICFAFPIITKLLAMLQLTNTLLFLLCTLGTFLIFALFYAFIYSATAKAYYKIVS